MLSAASSQAHGPPRGAPWGAGPRWNEQPWHPAWGPPWGWHGIPRPMAILFTVLGFIFWWPVGLALLFYMIGSGAMGCRSFRRRGNGPDGAWQSGGWANAPWAGWKSWCSGERPAPTSGNHAFDEYRAATLRRLEEEQQEFAAFLERLRFAKDKAEFDQFMADRRAPPEGSEHPAG